MNVIPGKYQTTVSVRNLQTKYHNIIVLVSEIFTHWNAHIISYKNLMASGWSVILFLIFLLSWSYQANH